MEPQVQSLPKRRLCRLWVLPPTAIPAKPTDAPTRAAPPTKPTATSALVYPLNRLCMSAVTCSCLPDSATDPFTPQTWRLAPS